MLRLREVDCISEVYNNGIMYIGIILLHNEFIAERFVRISPEVYHTYLLL